MSFATTLDTVIDLAPDRVALFGYAHLPAKLPHQRLVEKAGRVLDGYERATLLLLAIEKFTAAGYLHLGLDHFARPGSRLARAAAEHRMVRTFQGYVEHRADSVIGARRTSAISSTPRMLWQNHTQLAAWEHAIAAGQLPVERGYVLDRDDRLRRDADRPADVRGHGGPRRARSRARDRSRRLLRHRARVAPVDAAARLVRSRDPHPAHHADGQAARSQRLHGVRPLLTKSSWNPHATPPRSEVKLHELHTCPCSDRAECSTPRAARHDGSLRGARRPSSKRSGWARRSSCARSRACGSPSRRTTSSRSSSCAPCSRRPMRSVRSGSDG